MTHQYIVNTSRNFEDKFAPIFRTAVVIARNARAAIDRAEELLVGLQPGEYVNEVILTGAAKEDEKV